MVGRNKTIVWVCKELPLQRLAGRALLRC